MMPVKRRKAKARAVRITPIAIEAYRRMREIEAMDLPNGHELHMSGGEYGRAQHEITKAIGWKPWSGEDEVWEALRELHEAANLSAAVLEGLKVAAEKKRVREKILAADFVLNGCHRVGWDQEAEEADFESEWGVRPQDVDLSDLAAVRAHKWGI